MDDPLAVLIYSHSADYQPLLEWQLKQAGIEQHHVVLPDFSWRKRQLLTLDVARQFGDRLLIFPDAWDTVLLGTKGELCGLGLAGSVTVAAAKVMWPDDRRVDYDLKQGVTYAGGKVFSPHCSQWRYVNSNPLAGLGRDIARAIEWGWQRFPLLGDSSDTRTEDGEVCERFWTRLYLDGPSELGVRVDTLCELNQTYLCHAADDFRYEGGRLYNLKTWTRPCFLHLNGKHLLPEGLISL